MKKIKFDVVIEKIKLALLKFKEMSSSIFSRLNDSWPGMKARFGSLLPKKLNWRKPAIEDDATAEHTLPNLNAPKPTAKTWPERIEAFKESVLPALEKLWRLITAKAGVPNLDWDQFVNRVFGAPLRPHIHQFFLYGLALVSAFTLGKIIALLLTPTPTDMAKKAAPINLPDITQDQYQDLLSMTTVDLFKATGKKADSAKDERKIDKNLICKQADRTSELPIKLMHTTVLQDTVKSIASVQLRGNPEMQSYREGERIDSLAEIGKIDRLRVIFKNLQSGECEYIQSADDTPALGANPIQILDPESGRKLIQQQRDNRISSNGNNYKIKKGLLKEAMGNINELLTQARAVPIRNPDGSYEFKLTEIVPGSLYSQLDFQNGDVITSINGNKIQNINEVMTLFAQLKDVEDLQLGIKRDGVDNNFEYQFSE